jgi:pimeloyl-ACP methyl ester carboxylesterase
MGDRIPVVAILATRLGLTVVSRAPHQRAPRVFAWVSLLLVAWSVSVLIERTTTAAIQSANPSRRRLRRLAFALVIVVVVAILGYTGYVGYEASRRAVSVDEFRSRDCKTPMDLYGWAYEAINYPISDDARLRADNKDMTRCASQGVKAGDEVVTSDGVHIAGWYIPAGDGAPPTAATIVLVHGYGGNKSGILPYAPGLHQQFNLVAFDQRNGGRSTGTQTTLGVLEQKDVRAIIEWVERVKHPAHLGVFGNSMGAAAAVGEARTDKRVEALALDSMHTRIVYQFEQRLKALGHPTYPGTWATFIGTWLRTGVWFGSADPLDAIPDMGSRPIMLTHGTADNQDLPERTQAFYGKAKAAGLTIELHWCPGAGHGEADDVCPKQLASWLDTFFTRTLTQSDA